MTEVPHKATLPHGTPEVLRMAEVPCTAKVPNANISLMAEVPRMAEVPPAAKLLNAKEVPHMPEVPNVLNATEAPPINKVPAITRGAKGRKMDGNNGKQNDVNVENKGQGQKRLRELDDKESKAIDRPEPRSSKKVKANEPSPKSKPRPVGRSTRTADPVNIAGPSMAVTRSKAKLRKSRR
ncbi:uncharacterized protein LACBIDRAFT_314932 [Laccaria bicolor S238N-H82]|uniref:Predicted protein n=1 Tax=Laccaria bicolor (strain S238N-H82 / ATCC MYA-4686) TaxID=486041 RepID=B0DZH5_LACBS|nr:uncharacterized protein LACBIDRAFT_314932 [Laccaria bicolor S238N-H82]EDR00021.1 predicted protein [Laccaria bicolor S238N-H82]|eukprot:XP_001889330.1 predicted protein [Laccaria bicolor S238N-H82]